MSDGAVRARTRVVEVDAFKMTAEVFGSPTDWPDWLRDTRRRWPSVLNPGDWLILTAGELSVCTPAEYEERYEAVGEGGALYCGLCGSADLRALRVWCNNCNGLRDAAGEMIATTTLSEREAT